MQGVRESCHGVIDDDPAGAMPCHAWLDVGDSLGRRVYTAITEVMTSKCNNSAAPAWLSRPNPNASGIDVGGQQPFHCDSHAPYPAHAEGFDAGQPRHGLFLLVHRYIPDRVNAVAEGLAGGRVAEHQHSLRFDYAPVADQRTRRRRRRTPYR